MCCRMNLVLKRLVYTCLIIVIGLMAALLAGCGESGEGGPIGSKAPSFTLEDLDGNIIALEDFEGGPVLITFWQTQCPHCLEELSLLQEFYSSGSNPEVTLLAINIYNSESDVREVAAEKGLTFSILLDRDGHTAQSYGIYGVPANYFIDSAGIIREVRLGSFESIQEITQTLEDILN